jgi:hypothetical protein
MQSASFFARTMSRFRGGRNQQKSRAASSLNAVSLERDQLFVLPDARQAFCGRRNSRISIPEPGADTGANFALRNDLESIVPFPAI